MTGARLVLAVLFAVYLAAGVWTTRSLTTTGDEPYYFLAADSLLHGEGLELSARHYWLPFADYAPGDLLPAEDLDRSVAPSLSRPGRYPLHDPGLSLVIALPYAIGGRALVVALLGLAMAGALALACRASVALGVSRGASLAAALALGLSAPALTYSGQVFPDALASLPVAAALCALFGALPRWLLGPAIAALPLLHLRYWALAVALLLVALWLRPPTRRDLVALVGPLALVVVALAILDLVVYGVPLPHAGFLLFFAARADTSLAAYTTATHEARGPLALVGLFIDRAFGLLPAAPVALLLFVGAGVATRARLGRALLLAPLPYLVAISFLDWTGGYSPQARYLTALVPFFVPFVALALRWRPGAIVAAPLAVWTAGQSLVSVYAPGLRYDVYGVPPLADHAWLLVFGFAPSAAFPLLGADALTGTLTALWSALLAGLVLLGASVASHAIVTRPAQTLSP